jgi:hypothetical protein
MDDRVAKRGGWNETAKGLLFTSREVAGERI